MEKTIFVTGVTRMKRGFVCVSGIDTLTSEFVRPEIQYPERTGIKKEFLFVNGQPIIKPLVKVKLDFIKHIPQSEFHTEDWIINPNFKPTLVGIPDDKEKRLILQSHTDKSLKNVLSNMDSSLIIIKPKDAPKIYLQLYNNVLKCRIDFIDQSGDKFVLPVTDVNWLAICKHYWKKDRQKAQNKLLFLLKNKEIFLRIGITREWEGRKWEQISGIFTFPDYLLGKCYADFNYSFDDYV